MPASERLFTERANVLMPSRSQAAIKEAARHKGQTASEFIRQAVRDRLCRIQPAPAETEAH